MNDEHETGSCLGVLYVEGGVGTTGWTPTQKGQSRGLLEFRVKRGQQSVKKESLPGVLESRSGPDQ